MKPMSQTSKYDPLKTYFPFGPPIGYAKLPKEMIDDLNKGCDDIVKDEELSKSHDWSPYLVGQVEQEIVIPSDILNTWGRWFAEQIQHYIAGYFDQLYVPEQNLMFTDKDVALKRLNTLKIDVASAWYVRSFAGNYNPVHTHTDCQLTCVGYLKVPDLDKVRKRRAAGIKGLKAYTPDGNLEVLSSIGANPSVFENDRISFMPKVGNWYLFPAHIRHAAYPFNCEGERRSFSINMNTDMFRADRTGHSARHPSEDSPVPTTKPAKSAK